MEAVMAGVFKLLVAGTFAVAVILGLFVYCILKDHKGMPAK